ncbi:hypothetical protein ACQ4M3_05755 [Leptolyngbya sp. AN03gr2]
MNFVTGSFLLSRGKFAVGLTADTIAFFLGATLIAIGLAWHFGRVRHSAANPVSSFESSKLPYDYP